MDAHVTGLKTADTELHDATVWDIDTKYKKIHAKLEQIRNSTIDEVEKITEMRNTTISKLVLGRHEELQDQLVAFKAETMQQLQRVVDGQADMRSNDALRHQATVSMVDDKLNQMGQHTDHLLRSTAKQVNERTAEAKLEEMAHAQQLATVMDARHEAMQAQMMAFRQETLANSRRPV